jgi:predicted dehydrogenase
LSTVAEGGSRIRYAQVGLGVRSWLFGIALLRDHAERAELVGLCDSNAGRLAHRCAWARQNGLDARGYAAGDFERMLAECRPDCVIVTPPDCHHASYVCRAMERGCDVICEKPLTIDAPSLQRILDTQRATGRRCTVAFNYRYAPVRAQVKALLASGVIGRVVSLDFHWLLDTAHGADYFRRWHRNKASSGGLLVHKATHHFDLVNWWLDSVPVAVQASGARRFYTPETADRLGLVRRGERCLDCPDAGACRFHLDLRAEKFLAAVYLEHEQHDGYFRDRCVFSPEIDIEDSMNVLVDYRSGARMSYSLNAFMPREGYAISFNGTRGRLDHVCEESSYVSGSSPIAGAGVPERTSIRVQLHFERAREIEVATAEGSHGGGDARLLRDLFAGNGSAGNEREKEPDPLGRAADHRAGAWSVLTGIAANRSLETGERVLVSELVSGLELP